VNITVTRAASAVLDGNVLSTQRPNLVPGVPLYLDYGASGLWLNAAAFSVPAAGTWGNLGRNAVRAPGLFQINTAFSKKTRLREHVGAEFGFEVFNLANHPQLAAPSANLSNQISPTNAEHVRAQLDGKIPLVVDGGQSQVGIESTVLDLTAGPPQILRPGMIHLASLRAVAGDVRGLPEKNPSSAAALRSPGLLAKHYAPKAKLLVAHWQDEAELKWHIAQCKFSIAAVHIIAHTRIPTSFGAANVSVIPHDAEAFARALYAELHRCDAVGAQLIVVEAPPALPEWTGIADRLRRAAA